MKNQKKEHPEWGQSPFRMGTVPISPVPLSPFLRTAALLLPLALLLTACASPEANRVRGGGAGADVGNRHGEIEMHAGSTPYWRTPKIIGSETPPLASAEHARQGTRG